MRLATVRTQRGHRAVRLDGDTAVEIGDPDVGTLLNRIDWRTSAQAADGPEHSAHNLDFAPLVLRPEKVICVGGNYLDHIEEGREVPRFPTLFAKFSSALIGANDDILLPRVSDAVDWEAELAVIIGSPARHISVEEAMSAIAGYSILNDVSMRDYQDRTTQVLQGKMFEAATPLGPALVTPDEFPDGPGNPRISLEIGTEVDGERVQYSNTAQMVFDSATLIAYISDITTLRPGDVIATGTPGGIGHAHRPPRYLTDGAVVITRVAGIGECRNVCRMETV